MFPMLYMVKDIKKLKASAFIAILPATDVIMDTGYVTFDTVPT